MRFDAKGQRNTIKTVDAQAVLFSFKRADVSAIDRRRVGKRLLGKPVRQAKAFQVPGEMLPTGHQPERTSWSSDNPRSILCVHGDARRLIDLKPFAPAGDVESYDRRNLALYAALLEADDAGRDWRDAASSLMDLDVAREDAEVCWRSHIERARWIVGEGMEAAISAFSARPASDRH